VLCCVTLCCVVVVLSCVVVVVLYCPMYSPLSFLPKKVLELIKDMISLSLEKEGQKTSGLTFLLSHYRHASVHLALDLLIFFGEKTMLEIPKPEEPKEKKKEKSSEEEKEKKKGDEEEGGGAEEEEDEEEKKAKKAEKKAKKVSVEKVWRANLEETLDKLCEDEDSTVRDKALAVVTRVVF